MTASELVAATTISDVFVALGGDQPKKGRAKAFWRICANNPQAISLNDRKGVWFDHRDHVGGGVLSLIQHAHGCDRGRALRWLANFVGVPLGDRPMIAAQRRSYARAAAGADALAQRLADFANGLRIVTEQDLKVLSDFLQMLDVDPTEMLNAMHQQMYILSIASPEEIVAIWCTIRRENPAAVAIEKIGHKDREDAATITEAIVHMLANSRAITA